MNWNRMLSKQVTDLPRSGIREFFDLVTGSKDIISLGVGEPDFVTPWNIREAAITSLEKGHTTYTSNYGLESLRRAIATYVEGFFNVSYNPLCEILPTVGVSEAIDLALRCLINPGDEVLYHEPCYVSYAPSVSLCYGIPKVVETSIDDLFALNPARLEEAITPKTKVLMLNFPTNPTGSIAPLETLKAIADICIRHDLFVLTDEIYSELRYDGVKHVSIASLPGMKERTLLLHGFSKAFAMTGFRIGYACGPAAIIDAMMKIHQYSMLCAPITAQEAALEALRSGRPDMEAMCLEYRDRRNVIVDGFNSMGLHCFKPEGAFYVFPNITSTGLSSMEFAKKLLMSRKVAVVPGSAFGPCGEGFVRCSYATSMEGIKEALQKIGEFIKELPKA